MFFFVLFTCNKGTNKINAGSFIVVACVGVVVRGQMSVVVCVDFDSVFACFVGLLFNFCCLCGCGCPWPNVSRRVHRF